MKSMNSRSAHAANTRAATPAIDTAIQNTQAGGTGTSGAFSLRIEGPQASPKLTVVLSAGLTLAQIATEINQALAPHTTVTVGIAAPSDSPQMLSPGIIPMFTATSSNKSRSSTRPAPCAIRRAIFTPSTSVAREG